MAFAIGTLQIKGRTDSAENYSQGIPMPTSVSHKQSSPRPTWNLKYKSGSFQLRNGQWLKAAFVSNVPVAGHASTMVSILSDQVRAIYFDPKAEKDSDVAQRMPRSGCAYARDRMPERGSVAASATLTLWTASPGPVLRTAERLNQRHPVRIVWSENGTDKELILTVNHCEYASFAANLHWFVGQRWHDIERAFPYDGIEHP